MKKLYSKAVFVLMLLTSLVMLLFAASCVDGKVDGGSSGSSDVSAFEFSVETTNYWLDRYEEKTVELAVGNADELEWESSDTTVVTVEKGRLIAQGEGLATVTVKKGDKRVDLSVKVTDSGSKPSIHVEKTLVVYKDMETDLAVGIGYNEAVVVENAAFEATVADPTVAAINGAKIIGLTVGETEVTFRAGYKGLNLEKTVAVEVRQSSFVELSESEISLHNADNETVNAYTIDELSVVYKGQKVEMPEVVCSVVEGEEFVILEGAKVTAKAEGVAKIKVAYGDKDDCFAFLTVNVLPPYESEYFTNATTHVSYRETNANVGGREGGIYEYKYTELPEKETGVTYYNERIFTSQNGNSLKDLYLKGYRYFAFDLYCPNRENKNFYIHLYDNYYFTVGERFYWKDVKILDENGEVTDRIVPEQWITVVYDVYSILLSHPSGNVEFSYTMHFSDEEIAAYKAEGTLPDASYLTDIRYYFDDSFISDGGRVEYTEKEGCVEATPNEFSGFVHGGASYAPADKEVGGRTGVMKYTTLTDSRWSSALVNVSSLGESVESGMERLCEHGEYFEFDIYVEKASNLYFSLNHDGLSFTLRVGMTDARRCDWLYLYDENGNRLSTVIGGEWITVGLCFFEKFNASAWRSTLMFSVDAENGAVIYIDNLRYYENTDHVPETWGGVEPISEVNVTLLAESLERINSGEFEGSIRYTNQKENADGWSGGLYFPYLQSQESGAIGDFFADGCRYVKFDLYLEEADFVRGIATDWTNWAQERWDVGSTTHHDKDSNGSYVLYTYAGSGVPASCLEKGVWYTIYWDISLSEASGGKFCFIVDANGKTAVSYLRNIEFLKETPFDVEEFGAPHDRQFVYSSTFENEQVVKFVGYGEEDRSGFTFTGVENGSFFKDNYKYVKFDLYLENADYIMYTALVEWGNNGWEQPYWYKTKWDVGGNAKSDGNGDYIMLVGTDGLPCSALKTGKWITVYVEVGVTKIENTAIRFGVFSASGAAVAYLRDIEFLKEFPFEAAEEFGAPHNGQFAYSAIFEEKPVAKYVGYGEEDRSGLTFTDIENGNFFKDNYKYVKFDLYLENADYIMYTALVEWGNNGWEQPYWYKTKWDVGGNAKSDGNGDYITLIGADGAPCSSLETGKWMTVYVEIGVRQIDKTAIRFGIFSKTGAAIAYVRNLSFTVANDISKELLACNDGDSAVTLNRETVERNGGNVVAYKMVNKSSSNWSHGVNFAAVGTWGAANRPNGRSYVKFDLYIENAQELRAYVANDVLENVRIGEAFTPTGHKFYDAESGSEVTTLQTGKWYTVYFSLDITGDTHVFFDLYNTTDAENNPAVAYFMNFSYESALPTQA